MIPSLFVIIRLEVEDILPEYLGLYLNSDKLKRHYAANSIGSAIQIIKTSQLRDLEIEIPNIETQIKAISFYNLMLREKVLLSQLMVGKEKYNKEILNQLIVFASETIDH